MNLKDLDGTIYDVDFFIANQTLQIVRFLITKEGSKEEKEIGIHDQFQNMYLDAINKKFSVFEYSNFHNLNSRHILIDEVKKTFKLKY